MEERHRHAQAVVPGEAHALGDVVGVGEDAPVRQLGGFRETGRPGGVLDRGGVARIDGVLTAAQQVVGDAGARGEHLGPREHPGRGQAVEERDALQPREALAREPARPGAGELGAAFRDQVEAAGVAKAVDQKQGRRVRLLEHVGELAGAIRGIHRDEHRPDLGDRELEEDPLRPVGRPHRDVIALLDAETEQAFRELIAADEHVAIGPAHAVVGKDQRLAITRAVRDAIEEIADRDPLHGGRLASMLRDAPTWRTRSIACCGR